MNIENFYALRKLEWQAYEEHKAAIKIQSYFRKWLLRQNLKLVHAAATKIQSGIRGWLARLYVEDLREEREEERERQERERAATAIQAAYRGHSSRSRIFSYEKYKDIQRKNSQLSKSVSTINELESLLSSSYSSTALSSEEAGGQSEAESYASKVQSIVERLLSSETTVDDIMKLSPSRVQSILEHIEALNEECLKRGLRPKGMNIELVAKIRAERARREREQELDRLFPRMPSIPGLIRPKEEQVQRLRKAMEQLKCTLEVDQEQFLAKQHHLLRTYQRPGVLSDVTTHKLTPQEQKLKELKFWEMPRTLYTSNSRSRSRSNSVASTMRRLSSMPEPKTASFSTRSPPPMFFDG